LKNIIVKSNLVENKTDEIIEMKKSSKIMTNNNCSKENIETKLSHFPFEPYFESGWQKHFQEKETIQNILDAAGLSGSHDFVQINSKYLIDDNRIAIIALIKRKNSKVLEKLIIDVIAGNSSFDQVIDVVYNIGSDCDYRMIICDRNSKNEALGLRMTDNIMRQLINFFNQYLFLYWMSADALRDVDGTMKVIYNVIESVAKSDHFSDIPKRHSLEYAELYCYAMESSVYGQFLHEDEISFEDYWASDNARTEWKNEKIVTEIDMDQDDYKWVFKRRADSIKEDGCSCEYDKEMRLLTITEDLPFQNFKYLLPEEKSNLAGKYYHRLRISSWIDDLLLEKNGGEEDKKQR